MAAPQPCGTPELRLPVHMGPAPPAPKVTQHLDFSQGPSCVPHPSTGHTWAGTFLPGSKCSACWGLTQWVLNTCLAAAEEPRLVSRTHVLPAAPRQDCRPPGPLQPPRPFGGLPSASPSPAPAQGACASVRRGGLSEGSQPPGATAVLDAGRCPWPGEGEGGDRRSSAVQGPTSPPVLLRPRPRGASWGWRGGALGGGGLAGVPSRVSCEPGACRGRG